MRLGAHMSTAGGTYTAFKRGREATCDSILIFTKSNRQWRAKPLTDKDVQKFQEAAAEYGDIFPTAVHASYLINIASPKPDLWQKSLDALQVEVERAGQLGIPLLTFHPGSYVTSDEQTGLDNIVRALKQLLADTAVTAPNVTICLETMAGQGTNLGHRFEQLAYLLENAGPSARLGVCFDTCHVFAAGYDMRTPEAYAETMAEFDRVIGLDHIKCFHFNDSKFELSRRKDRHAHIGDGFIGREGFANFVNDPRWADHAAHLETPKTEEDDDGNEIEMDVVNLARLRELIR
ncbi:MAG: deoxyribonuclease IV [Anaerolineae bacterium]